jgi:hypothetical protein
MMTREAGRMFCCYTNQTEMEQEQEGGLPISGFASVAFVLAPDLAVWVFGWIGKDDRM